MRAVSSIRRFALPIYGVAGTIAVLLLLNFAIPNMVDAWKQYPWDGKVDWIAARAYVEHRNPYSPEELRKVKLDGLGHPPTTSFWWIPFARYELMQVSPLVGHWIVFALLTVFMLLALELRWPIPVLSALLGFSLTMSASWMYYHLYLVQVSGFIAFLYYVAWVLLRRDQELAAGILLGCACTFKLFPGLLVLMLLLARRLRPVVAAVVTYLAIAAFMTARFGLESWKQYAATEGVITQYWMGNAHNASLFGVVLRWFQPACVGPALPRAAASAIAVVIALGLVAGAWWLSRRLLAERRYELPFMLFAILSVFMNPFTFEHYFVLLVFPIIVAWTAWWQARRDQMPRRQWLAVAALLAVATGCLALKFRWQDEVSFKAHHFLRHILEYTNWIHMPLAAAAVALLIHFSNVRGTALLRPATRE